MKFTAGLTFVVPFIVINFYSKTNQMHNILNIFYFGTTLYMLLTVFPSIIRSLKLYIQHQTIQILWLLASKKPQNLYDIYLMLYIQSYTRDDGQRDFPKHVECCSKINLKYCASGWFYCRNLLPVFLINL
jgi:hypothetical protein